MREREFARHLIGLAPLLGVLQNNAAPMIIDNPPFFDLFQGSMAAEAPKVIVQTAVPYARGLSAVIDIIHCRSPMARLRI
jgi:hypothetical protein